MTMSSIHDKHVHTGLHQCSNTILCVRAGTHRRCHTQSALQIFSGTREIFGLADIFKGNQTTQFKLVIDHQNFFNPVLVQELFNLVVTGIFFHRYQTRLGCHDGFHSGIQIGFKTHITTGHNAYQLTPDHNRHA